MYVGYIGGFVPFAGGPVRHPSDASMCERCKEGVFDQGPHQNRSENNTKAALILFSLEREASFCSDHCIILGYVVFP